MKRIAILLAVIAIGISVPSAYAGIATVTGGFPPQHQARVVTTLPDPIVYGEWSAWSPVDVQCGELTPIEGYTHRHSMMWFMVLDEEYFQVKNISHHSTGSTINHFIIDCEEGTEKEVILRFVYFSFLQQNKQFDYEGVKMKGTYSTIEQVVKLHG